MEKRDFNRLCSRGVNLGLFMNIEHNQKRPFLLVGDWKPYQEEDKLLSFLEQIKENIKETPFSFYAALPFTWIQHEKIAKLEEDFPQKNIRLGSRSVMYASSEAFSSLIAFSVLKESKAQFILLDPYQEEETPLQHSEKIQKILHPLLEKGIPVILNLRRAFQQKRKEEKNSLWEIISSTTIPDTMQTALKNEMQTLLMGLSHEAIQHLMIVIPSFPYHACGLKNVSEASLKIHTMVRTLLGEILKEEGSKIPLLAPLPCYLKNGTGWSDLLDDLSYDGFLFTQLPNEQDLVLKILKGDKKEEIFLPQEKEKVNKEEEIKKEQPPSEIETATDSPLPLKQNPHTISNLTSWGETA